MNVFFSATSYPRSEADWQGTFIRNLASALSNSSNVNLCMWTPPGPMPKNALYLPDTDKMNWLKQLADEGGVVHLLRKKPIKGLYRSAQLLHNLGSAYSQSLATTDIYHVNWLQNAIPLTCKNKGLVVSALGTDIKFLRLPGVVSILRNRFKRNNTTITPNARWMVPVLEKEFGDVCKIKHIPFGVSKEWFEMLRSRKSGKNIWLAVYRVTEDKIGPLLEWGESIFQNSTHELHIIGPNQEEISLPSWAHYHGSKSPKELVEDWFPNATGLISLSNHNEGRPQVMLEALASGIPIIASNIPAHSDFIKEGSTGKIVSCQDEFLQALDFFAEETTRYVYSNSCRSYAKNNYGDWDDCAKKYINTYTEMLA